MILRLVSELAVTLYFTESYTESGITLFLLNLFWSLGN